MNFDYPCRAKITLAVLIALVLFSQLHVVLTRNPSNRATGQSNEVTRYHERFENLRRMLPRQGPVGYIGDTDNPLENGSSVRAYYLAQYVLSPIVLSRGTEPPLVVGNFRQSESHDLRLEKKGLMLLKDFGDGVQLFRHRKEEETPQPSSDNGRPPTE